MSFFEWWGRQSDSMAIGVGLLIFVGMILTVIVINNICSVFRK